MKNEQIELGGITLTDKRKGEKEKRVNAGEIVIDVIAEKRKEQEKLEAKRRDNWKKFKQETTIEIDPDLLKETDEELAAGEYDLNPDGTKREERRGRHGGHKKIDLKRITRDEDREKRQEILDVEAEEKCPQEKRVYKEKRVEEKVENPELAEKINIMAKLSGESWNLFQTLEEIKKETKELELKQEGDELRQKRKEVSAIYDNINEISKELIFLYYMDVKKELGGNPNNVYKLEGVNEGSAKMARGAIGRIEEGKTFIKIEDIKDGNSWMKFKVNKEDLEKLADVEKEYSVNEAMDIWGKKQTLLRVERGQESEYRITYFNPNDGYIELKTKDGKETKSRALYLYIINCDKAGKEIKTKTEEEILTVFKDKKTLLRIKENAKREYVLATYNSGAEYSYVETPDGKDRQRVRSKDVYALNADVIDNIEKTNAEMVK